MNLYQRLNINRKILLFVNLPLLLFLLIILIILIYNQRNTLVEMQSEYEQDMARNAAQIVSSALYRDDYYTINVIVESIQEYPGNLYAQIFKEDGLVITPSSKSPDPTYTNYSLKREEVYYRGNKIGYVVLAFDLKPIDIKALKYAASLSYVTVFILILVGSILYFSIRFIVIKPLSEMLCTVAGISVGNFNLEVPVLSEDEIGVLANNFNKMVKKLRESMALNHGILESMPSALIAIDEDFRIISWNSHVKKYLNISENVVEISDQHVEPISDRQTEEKTPPLTTDLYKLQNSSIWDSIPFLLKQKKISEHVLKTKKPLKLHREAIGNEEFYQLFLFPLVNSDINGLVFRIDDVTNDEKKDAQLREALKLDTLGALASGLAHDFNNVLCGIVSAVSILKFRLQNKANLTFEKIENLTNVIDESAIRAEEMVKQFLNLSRRQELNFTTIDINASIAHIAKIGKNTFDKSVKIDTILYPDKALAIVDRTQIEQVFLNLAVNGSHAMTLMKKANWGGTLTIKVEETYIDDTQKLAHPDADTESYWKISFADQGVGMTDDIKKKIFEPFFTTKDVGKGTGLGLSMVFNIVSMHNGFIELESEFGAGSTFIVYLPKIVIEENQNEQNTSKLVIHKGKGEHVIVVDDELVVRQTIHNILEEANYKITLTDSGKHAIDIYKENYSKIDIAIIDYKMHDMNGIDTFIELKKINPDIKAIFSSGLKIDDILESLKNLGQEHENVQSIGFKDFIQKPYTLSSLTKMIMEVLKSHS